MPKKNKPGSWKRFRKRFISLERYENGKLICHYCNTEIDMEVKPPKPKALTLDHIIPLSKGGGLKDSENVVICCFSCNMEKADN